MNTERMTIEQFEDKFSGKLSYFAEAVGVSFNTFLENEYEHYLSSGEDFSNAKIEDYA